ncbi:membrane protein [Mycobacterium sp. SWH-M1]|nr:membrane protein [Mycobacterium sp. SWH-M1]
MTPPERTPWGTGLTVAAFVAAVLAAILIVLGIGLMRVNPLLAIGLNLVAVGGLAPTVWGWRKAPVWRWFVLGAVVGVAAAWLGLLALAAAGTYA